MPSNQRLRELFLTRSARLQSARFDPIAPTLRSLPIPTFHSLPVVCLDVVVDVPSVRLGEGRIVVQPNAKLSVSKVLLLVSEVELLRA